MVVFWFIFIILICVFAFYMLGELTEKSGKKNNRVFNYYLGIYQTKEEYQKFKDYFRIK